MPRTIAPTLARKIAGAKFLNLLAEFLVPYKQDFKTID